MTDSLWPRELQHTRLPCPSPSPGACSNSYPLSQWCHTTISSSVAPFFFCPHSFPASGSFPMSQFSSGGQSIGASTSESILPMNIQGWFPSRLTGLVSLLSKGLSRVFSNTAIWKNQFSGAQPSVWSNTHYQQSLHDYWKNPIALTIWAFAGKVMSLLFNTLSRFVIAFLPRSKHLLISWLQPPSTVIFSSVQLLSSDFRAWENKICHCFHFFPFYLPWSDGTRSIIMALW